MFIAEMFEPRSYVNEDSTRVVVTYPGRFQPFHLGHADVFRQLQNKFGQDNVFIVTSNDTSSAKSPFNFNDKVQLMTAAGVPAGRIIESNKPYEPPEQFGYNVVFITALGAPDAERLAPDSVLKRDKKDKAGNVIKPAGSPSYFKTFKSMADCDTADNHGYVIIIPEAIKEITIGGKQVDVSHGTPAREVWNMVRDDESLRAEYLTQMFGRDDVELGRIMDKIPHTMNEDAGGVGVIASKSQARDPRYSMSLTQDVRPGETDRQLRKMHLKDSRARNHPTRTVEEIAKKHSVTEDYVNQQLERGIQVESERTKIRSAAREIALDNLNEGPDYYKRAGKRTEDRHPNDKPYGPETKPTMLAGTVRVDVSDVYDWYKLGMHISDLDGLGKHDFGKGPPSTIFSFGSEEQEHEYLKNLEKTGLTTTDIDPRDPNPPKGMKRQKTDPTFNVNESLKPKKARR